MTAEEEMLALADMFRRNPDLMRRPQDKDARTLSTQRLERFGDCFLLEVDRLSTQMSRKDASNILWHACTRLAHWLRKQDLDIWNDPSKTVEDVIAECELCSQSTKESV